MKKQYSPLLQQVESICTNLISKTKENKKSQINKSLRQFSPYASLNSFNRNFSSKQKSILNRKQKLRVNITQKQQRHEDKAQKYILTNQNLYISLSAQIQKSKQLSSVLICIQDLSSSQKTKSYKFQILKYNTLFKVTQDNLVEQIFSLNIFKQDFIKLKLESYWKITDLFVNNCSVHLQKSNQVISNNYVLNCYNINPLELINENKRIRLSKLLQKPVTLKINWSQTQQNQNTNSIRYVINRQKQKSQQQIKKNNQIELQQFKLKKQPIFSKYYQTLSRQNYQKAKQNRPRSSFKSLKQKNQYFSMKQSQRKKSIKKQSGKQFSYFEAKPRKIYDKEVSQVQIQYGINYQTLFKNVKVTQKNEWKFSRLKIKQG